MNIIKNSRDEKDIVDYNRKRLLEQLDNQKDNYDTSFQYYKTIEERKKAIENMINTEIDFMTNIVYTIYGKITQCENPNNIILLWDIDDTLTRYRGKVIRPSFKFIYETIKYIFPNVLFGICSARKKEHIISEFYPLYNNYFDENYIFSSRDDGYELCMDKKLWGNITSMAYINKINAYNRISKKHPDKEFILIDDMIDEKFEQINNGISISNQSQHLIFLIEENIIHTFE